MKSVTNRFLRFEYVKSNNLFTTSLSCFSINDSDVEGVFHVLPLSPRCHLLPLQKANSSHPTLSPHRAHSSHITQTFLKSVRACFYFAIFLSFGFWNIQSHFSPFIFEICPQLIFPIFETISICSKLFLEIFTLS